MHSGTANASLETLDLEEPFTVTSEARYLKCAPTCGYLSQRFIDAVLPSWPSRSEVDKNIPIDLGVTEGGFVGFVRSTFRRLVAALNASAASASCSLTTIDNRYYFADRTILADISLCNHRYHLLHLVESLVQVNIDIERWAA